MEGDKYYSEHIDEIYLKYFRCISRYCYSELGNIQEAEDCAGEVFEVFVRKAADIDDSVDIRLWLLKVAKNKIMNTINLRRCTDILFDEIEFVGSFSEECGFDKGKYELLEDVLSEKEIKLLEDYYLSGKKTKEIAEEYKISGVVLRKRISRIKKKIEKHLDLK